MAGYSLLITLQENDLAFSFQRTKGAKAVRTEGRTRNVGGEGNVRTFVIRLRTLVSN